ncbi:MAG: primosomal protein N' [Rubricella sp.]
MKDGRFAEGAPVAVLTVEPVGRMLDYRAPQGGVAEGALVQVPLGPRKVLGAVWGPGQGDYPVEKLRPILTVLDVPPLPEVTRAFLDRVADYTLSDPGAILRLATRAPGLADPPGKRKVYTLGRTRPERMTDARRRVLEALADYGGAPLAPMELARLAGVSASVVKGLEAAGALVLQEAPRDAPYPRLDPARPGKALSPSQKQAAETLRAALSTRDYGTTLLRGVTGSGKTEAYLEAVAACLEQGRQALVLLPEIALTGQFLERVEARFGALPVEWHSGVTMANRRRAWLAVAKGEGQLVVGARSALFLPFRDLGLVVVDEEHDPSYKQEDGVLYNARDMAVLRASMVGARVILASATPSLETWANAEAGRYDRIDLEERFGEAVMPVLKAVDMRGDQLQRNHWIGSELGRAIFDRLERKEQVLLFLNRRGYAPLTVCRACGHQIGCRQCDARMVEHRFLDRLVCHQCGEDAPIPKACPSCGKEGTLAAIGPGVERLAEEVAERFPDASSAILSSDITDSARALRERIEAIAGGETDIVIGTQIVAKGHNFPRLTLVGVIDADIGLQGADLRAAERTFQLVRQVTGRAGRAERPGTALIQTHMPDHAVMQAIVGGDDEAFLREEAIARKELNAPPFGRWAGVIVSATDEALAFDVARALARDTAPFEPLGARVLGPALAPIGRIRGRTRVRLLVKAPKAAPLQQALRAWRARARIPSQARVTIDVDPQSFF